MFMWCFIFREVCEVLEEYGCFVVLYDGVMQELDDLIFVVVEELFDFLIDIKRKNVNEKLYYGYVG